MAKNEVTGLFEHLARLKELKREGWVRYGIKDCESVADHSFSTAVLAMMMADELGLDTEKAVKMALLHDLAESVTGDITILEKEKMGSETVMEAERKAMKKILSGLPESLRAEYISLFEEYCNGKTEEASLVKDIDKLEMLLQAKHYQNKHGKDLKDFFDKAMPKIKRKELLKIPD